MAIVDSFKDKLDEYTDAYISDRNKESFKWFCLGAFFHQSVIADADFWKFLDIMRTSYTELRERLDANS